MLTSWILLGIWTLACAAGAWKRYRIKQGGAFYNEHVLYGTSLLLLAMAPWTSLLVYLLTPIDHPWIGAGQFLGSLLTFGVGRRLRSNRLNANTDRASHTCFRERSALFMLATLLVLTVGVLIWVMNKGFEYLVPAVLGFVFWFVVVAIVGHIAIALLQNPIEEANDPPDERDRAVDQNSIRNAYYTIVSGIWVIPVFAVTTEGYVSAVACCILILAAELVYYGSMVRYYRVGVY